MSDQDAFERILASLYDAMLDDTLWPATSALIDEACGTQGNGLVVSAGPQGAVQTLSAGLYYRGQRRADLERNYFESYHPIDERLPRLQQLPDSHLVHITDLYTPKELKTSPTYNEALARAHGQDGLNICLAEPDGSRITVSIADPVTPGGWASAQLALIKGLLPHLRQFVRVRQALVSAEALNASVTELLDTSGMGVIHLDQRGQIMAANDRAQALLRRGDGLTDRGGVLRAQVPADHARLERLMAGALPPSGVAAVSGSMPLRRATVSLPFVVHVTPVGSLTARLWRAAGRRAGAAGRAGAAAAYRAGLGGRDPGADPGGEPHRSLVGARSERARDGRGDGAHGRHHPLPLASDVPEAGHLPASRLDTAGAVAR